VFKLPLFKCHYAERFLFLFSSLIFQETDVVAADDTSASQGVPVATEGKAAIDATATASP